MRLVAKESSLRGMWLRTMQTDADVSPVIVWLRLERPESGSFILPTDGEAIVILSTSFGYRDSVADGGVITISQKRPHALILNGDIELGIDGVSRQRRRASHLLIEDVLVEETAWPDLCRQLKADVQGTFSAALEGWLGVLRC